ncbi:D-tyrosyl-tRNA(Tyr) deacylase [Litorivivens lipolytica]|uniref:D-aminoacyl-tRNA deacylase n=1 Tax=Litorivivens lipolytica TaxID=1524264 RepID=A0A7W4W7Y9_9GAMM|nr:D-tyrosyl-tRNA(Tyr) deacylase [Litorivivens lipolytica]
MKVLIQRVCRASVTVDEEVTGEIDQGMLVFVGIERDDNPAMLDKVAERLLNYRVFADEEGRMNASLRDINGGLLLVSQFTLAADTRKGLRPGFSSAATPADAQLLYNALLDTLKEKHDKVAAGRFAADMQVSLVNDGPVTFLLEFQ